jgi:hypothetical protein
MPAETNHFHNRTNPTLVALCMGAGNNNNGFGSANPPGGLKVLNAAYGNKLFRDLSTLNFPQACVLL